MKATDRSSEGSLTSVPAERGILVINDNRPAAYPINGNVSSIGKIYSVPGGASCSRTNPEECFGAEAVTRTAGFRKSRR